VLHALKAQGILGGLNLTHDYPELGQSLLVCATETKSAGDLKHYSDNMARIFGKRYRPAPCALKAKP
jgi:glycine dehydrogenase subunit 1